MRTKFFLMMLAAIVMGSQVTLFAQEKKGAKSERRQFNKEQMLEIQCNQIIKGLALDDATTAKFIPVYKQYMEEMRATRHMGACEINQKDLEKALAVTHPTMTEIIKRLEKKKAVICTQSKVDARYKKINCADEYKNIHIELKKMDWEIFNKICAGIPEEDIQTFLKASEKMLENIEK